MIIHFYVFLCSDMTSLTEIWKTSQPEVHPTNRNASNRRPIWTRRTKETRMMKRKRKNLLRRPGTLHSRLTGLL